MPEITPSQLALLSYHLSRAQPENTTSEQLVDTVKNKPGVEASAWVWLSDYVQTQPNASPRRLIDCITQLSQEAPLQQLHEQIALGRVAPDTLDTDVILHRFGHEPSSFHAFLKTTSDCIVDRTATRSLKANALEFYLVREAVRHLIQDKEQSAQPNIRSLLSHSSIVEVLGIPDAEALKFATQVNGLIAKTSQNKRPTADYIASALCDAHFLAPLLKPTSEGLIENFLNTPKAIQWRLLIERKQQFSLISPWGATRMGQFISILGKEKSRAATIQFLAKLRAATSVQDFEDHTQEPTFYELPGPKPEMLKFIGVESRANELEKASEIIYGAGIFAESTLVTSYGKEVALAIHNVIERLLFHNENLATSLTFLSSRLADSIAAYKHVFGVLLGSPIVVEGRALVDPLEALGYLQKNPALFSLLVQRIPNAKTGNLTSAGVYPSEGVSIEDGRVRWPKVLDDVYTFPELLHVENDVMADDPSAYLSTGRSCPMARKSRRDGSEPLVTSIGRELARLIKIEYQSMQQASANDLP